MENEKKNDFLLPASIIVAGVLISGSIIYLVGSKNVPPSPGADNNPAPSANVADILKLTNEDVVLGDASAPVTIVEYGDYQCPFCEVTFQDVEKRLRKEYVETGKVKIVYRDFPLDGGANPLHPYARAAAEAANCAKDQSKFWLYHDALFERQKQIPTMDFVALATELGLNSETFRTCVESRKYKTKVEVDQQGGVGIGVNGTPATFIGTQLISGAQPYEVFKGAIDQALNSL